mmetsp:Transcript_59308/g.165596  ORF Transcript_59308/g.165596 Transcript_59308/m.165596 type:complete len:83 (+) Transcript_59308:40-288(+)
MQHDAAKGKAYRSVCLTDVASTRPKAQEVCMYRMAMPRLFGKKILYRTRMFRFQQASRRTRLVKMWLRAMCSKPWRPCFANA